MASKPTWVATVPAGHTDGVPRSAVEGSHALVNGRPYRIIGAVSASHTIIEVGPDQTVEVGDVATLVGPDRPALRPITVARRTGLERDYWLMTKLNALLARRVVDS